MMSAVDPVFAEILQTIMPRNEERGVIQKKIEALIETLHPDGLEASEILAALSACVKQRYDNQLVSVAKIEDYTESLQKTFERAYEAA